MLQSLPIDKQYLVSSLKDFDLKILENKYILKSDQSSSVCGSYTGDVKVITKIMDPFDIPATTENISKVIGNISEFGLESSDMDKVLGCFYQFVSNNRNVDAVSKLQIVVSNIGDIKIYLYGGSTIANPGNIIKVSLLVNSSESGGSKITTSDDYFNMLDQFASVEMRRMNYRGKNLGHPSEITEDQWNAIADGTFKGFFVGDYWKDDDGHIFKIADIDYWYRTGKASANRLNHHLVIVLDGISGVVMFSNDTLSNASGGVTNATIYTNTLVDVTNNIITPAFGVGHQMPHVERYYRILTNSYPTDLFEVSDSRIDLLNGAMIGVNVYTQKKTHNINARLDEVDIVQLALFRHSKSEIFYTTDYWLRDLANSSSIAYISAEGYQYMTSFTKTSAVRPVFALCKEILT